MSEYTAGTDEMQSELEHFFESYEEAIDVSGMMVLLQQQGMNLNTSELVNLIDVLDRNKDGQIELDEVKQAIGDVTCSKELLEKTRLLALFNKLDTDLSGEIDVNEWESVFLDMKHNRYHFCIFNDIDEETVKCVDDVNDEDFRLLFKSIDTDNTGTIDFQEFYKLFDGSHDLSDLVKCAKLRIIFNRIDDDLNGNLEWKEISHMFSSEGFNLSDWEVKQLVAIIDENNDGKVDFDEFKHAFENIDNLSNLLSEWKSMISIDIGNDLSYSQYIETSSSDSSETSSNTMFGINKKFFAGGTGGIVSKTLTAPLERIKIISQITSVSGIRDVYNSIIAKQGYRGLWQGNGINCLRVFPFGGCVTFTYNYVLDAVVRYDPNIATRNDIGDSTRFAAGALAGSIATTLTYPMDVLKTHVSLNLNSNKIEIDLFQWNLLFRGLAPTLLAMSTMVGLQNMTYDECIKFATVTCDLDPSVSLFMSCGMVAGLVAQGAVYPLDVIRRHLQVMEPEEVSTVSGGAGGARVSTLEGVGGALGGGKVAYVEDNRKLVIDMNRMMPSSVRITKDLVQKQGARTLYNGLLATYLKTVPCIAVAMSVRDTILGKLKTSNNNEKKD